MVLFSANGDVSLQAWGNAPGILTAAERALKARLNRERCFNPTLAEWIALCEFRWNPQMTQICADNRRGLFDESRFQRWLVCVSNPGALPQAYMKAGAFGAKKILIARADR